MIVGRRRQSSGPRVPALALCAALMLIYSSAAVAADCKLHIFPFVARGSPTDTSDESMRLTFAQSFEDALRRIEKDACQVKLIDDSYGDLGYVSDDYARKEKVRFVVEGTVSFFAEHLARISMTLKDRYPPAGGDAKSWPFENRVRKDQLADYALLIAQDVSLRMKGANPKKHILAHCFRHSSLDGRKSQGIAFELLSVKVTDEVTNQLALQGLAKDYDISSVSDELVECADSGAQDRHSPVNDAYVYVIQGQIETDSAQKKIHLVIIIICCDTTRKIALTLPSLSLTESEQIAKNIATAVVARIVELRHAG